MADCTLNPTTSAAMATILGPPETLPNQRLSFSDQGTVPHHYRSEAQRFPRDYSGDNKFTMHDGVDNSWECAYDMPEIPLAHSYGAATDGNGSIDLLDPYKRHILTHPTHRTSHHARVDPYHCASLGAAPSASGTSRLVADLNFRGNSPPSEPISPPQAIYARPQAPQSARSFRKTSGSINRVELSDSDPDDRISKKPRLSSPIKQPLGTFNSNILASPTVVASPKVKSPTTSLFPPLLASTSLQYAPPMRVNDHPSSNASFQKLRQFDPQPASQVCSFGPSAQTGIPTAVPQGPSNAHLGPFSPTIFGMSPSNEDRDVLHDHVTGDGNKTNLFDKKMIQPIPGRHSHPQIGNIHAFVESHHQEAFGGNTTVTDALKGLGLPELGHTLPGMQLALLAHQVIGVNWMKSRERESAKFTRGGILADAMGLGKTMQTIGLMCANRSNDPECKGTLIIAPLALLEQWRQEIAIATEDGTFKVLIYHGPSRPKDKHVIQQYDVIITTYQTLANEWPDEGKEVKSKPKKKSTKKITDGSFPLTGDVEKKKYGPLMDLAWWRVVLDEAQCIRNAKTRVSCAVTHIIAENRWCLTGTPLINSLNDVYGLLRFIQHKPFGDWDTFKNIAKGADDAATKRVQHALAGVLLRRTKDSELDGRKIIVLPSRREEWIELDFMPEEREIYNFVEARAQAVFNRFLAAGTVLKNYSNVLVMLMRLRQICVHPCLLKMYESAYDVHDTRAPEAKRILEDATNLVSPEFVILVKRQLRELALERISLEKTKGKDATVDDNCSICLEPFEGDAVVAAPCAHAFCRNCIEGHIKKPRVDEENAKYKEHERDCPLCRQTISLNLLFQRWAFEPTNEELEVSDVFVEGLDISWDAEKGGYTATMAKKKLRKHRLNNHLDLDGFIVEEEEEDDAAAYKPGKAKHERIRKLAQKKNACDILSGDESEKEEKNRKGKKKEDDGVYVFSEDSDDEGLDIGMKKADECESAGSSASVSFIPTKAVDPVNKPEMMASFLPSTKMQHMMRYIQNLAESNSEDKTMVVSQWTSALDICSDYLNEYGIRHVRFQGSMSVRERNEAVRVFMSKSTVKVMLMSLKCGGIGLNLTRGNHVISLDLGWSNAVDQQAFDRVYRLGQTKGVFINRLMIKDTVEARVRAIQQRKQSLSDGALGEGSGQRIRLSVGELAHLFGLGAAPNE